MGDAALPRHRLVQVRVELLLFREEDCSLLKAKVKHGSVWRGQARSSGVFTSIFKGLAFTSVSLRSRVAEGGLIVPPSAMAPFNVAFPSVLFG